MKRLTAIFSAGVIGLLAFPGCGNDNRQSEREAIRDLEESFALDPESESASPRQSPPAGDTGQRSPGRNSSPPSAPAQEVTRTSENSGRSSDGSATDTPQEVDPRVREIARETVRMMESGQYESVIGNLDRLMAAPDLTPGQRRAARRTMAEVQKRIVTDPTIGEAEKERARRVLDRH